MKAIDLFCGCGGFSLGAHAAGFDVACAYDIDPILTSSFETNFPKTKLKLCDISTLTSENILSDAGGEIDLLFGGPPCQGFSSIGKREKSDVRRTLLGHFFRLVAEVRPAVFVMENVRGLSFAGAKSELNDALDKIPNDYVVSKPMVLDASDFGAATRRQRLFVIGYDPKRCGEIDFDALTDRKDRPATVRDAIGDLAMATPADGSDDDLWLLPNDQLVVSYANDLRHESRQFTGNRRTKHTAAVVSRFAKVSQGEMERVGRHPRLAWDKQCPALRAGTGADKGSFQSVRPIHPVENRVITVREGARLQGFPDGHGFHETVWHSFRMIGNSVSPIIAQAILSVVSAAIANRPEMIEAA